MIDYAVHVGPYLRCTYTLEPATRTMYTCPNRDCENHGTWLPQREAYCSLCGSPTGDYPAKHMAPPESVLCLYEVIGEVLRIMDFEHIEGTHVWVPNVGRNAPREMMFDPIHHYGIFPLGDEASEKAWFLGAFAEEIKLFLGAYDSVTLEWGILIEAS
jgi:hypothetical protein